MTGVITGVTTGGRTGGLGRGGGGGGGAAGLGGGAGLGDENNGGEGCLGGDGLGVGGVGLELAPMDPPRDELRKLPADEPPRRELPDEKPPLERDDEKPELERWLPPLEWNPPPRLPPEPPRAIMHSSYKTIGHTGGAWPLQRAFEIKLRQAFPACWNRHPLPAYPIPAAIFPPKAPRIRDLRSIPMP